MESYRAIDTYLLAENKDYKEYPLVEYYDGEFSVNVKVRHKAEVIIQSEEWTKKLYFEWKGKLSFFEFVQHLEDYIEDAAMEGELKDQGVEYVENYEELLEEGPFRILMYNKDGEILEAYLGKNELLNSIISVRLIEFEEQIIED